MKWLREGLFQWEKEGADGYFDYLVHGPVEQQIPDITITIRMKLGPGSGMWITKFTSSLPPN
jgi:hypothetical protein